MNKTIRITRTCKIEDLSAGLKAAMRAHVAQYQLGAIESDILMCCETVSTQNKNGLFGTTRETTASAVYVTPKWLVWADSTGRNNANAGSAQLKQIDIHDYETTAMFEITPDHGLNITGRYTNVNQTGITFIALGADPDGQRFRELLGQAMKKAA